MNDDDYRKRLEQKLDPVSVLSTLSFAGLVTIVYELIKQAVVENVKGFYSLGSKLDHIGYGRDVLALDKNRFTASACWLVNNGAITADQLAVLEKLHAHRHEAAHELARYIVDVDHDLDIELFGQALAVLRDIHRFWTQIEIDVGSFELHGDVTTDDAVPLALIVLQHFIDAYTDGITKLHRLSVAATE